MDALKFQSLSSPEAEEMIVEIWSCLEQFDIPSPALKVKPERDGRVSLILSFAQPHAADILSMHVGGLRLLDICPAMPRRHHPTVPAWKVSPRPTAPSARRRTAPH